jgi:hypothetical protein
LTTWLAGDGVDRTAYPNVDRHYQAMSERAAVQKVLPSHPGSYQDLFNTAKD